jgi:outer membrane autotransporter protein
VQIDNQWLSAFSESATLAGTMDPGTFGLHYGSQTVLSLPVSLGLQADTSFTADDGRMLIVPAARLAWMHEFEAERPTTQSFLIAPGFDFTTDGADALRDAFRLDTGISLNIGERFAVYGNFTGVFSHDGGSLGGGAGFRLSF